MGIFIGERISKITAEKGKHEGPMEVSISPKVTNLKVEKIVLGGEEKKTIGFEFDFTVSYGKEAGKIQILGELFYSDTNAAIEKIEQDWTKEKKLVDNKLRLAVMNRVLEMGYVKAIGLSETLRLPVPLQMPRFVAQANGTAAKKEK